MQLTRGSLPTMFCSEMRCSCSQQTFILSISFNHIPSIEKNVPFFYTIAKTMFFPASFLEWIWSDRDQWWDGGQKILRASNNANISLSLAMPPLPPPPTHTHTQRETNKQTDKKTKRKIPSLMKSHSHKKYLVKFSTPQKSRNQKTSNPPPPNPSIAPLIWNPDFPRLQGVSSDDLHFSSTLEEF